MKRTMVTEKIDDIDIVLGFDSAVIDPIATHEKVMSLLKATDEHSLCAEKSQLIAEKTKQRIKLLGKRAVTKEAKDEKKAALEELDSEITTLQTELKDGLTALNEKSKELHTNNLIYFEPKLGEEIIEDETIIEKFGKLKKDEVLTTAGDAIPNHKGKRFYKMVDGEWTEGKVKKLGEDIPSGAKVDGELTEEEIEGVMKAREKKRVAGLTQQEKKREKEAALNQLLIDAANKKTQLEVLGDEDPLGKSQAWYNEKKAEIEAKYV